MRHALSREPLHTVFFSLKFIASKLFSIKSCIDWRWTRISSSGKTFKTTSPQASSTQSSELQAGSGFESSPRTGHLSSIKPGNTQAVKVGSPYANSLDAPPTQASSSQAVSTKNRLSQRAPLHKVGEATRLADLFQSSSNRQSKFGSGNSNTWTQG